MTKLPGCLLLTVALLAMCVACGSPSQETLVELIDQCDREVPESRPCYDLFDHFNKGIKEGREVCEAVRVAIATDKVGLSWARLLDCYVPLELYEYVLGFAWELGQ